MADQQPDCRNREMERRYVESTVQRVLDFLNRNKLRVTYKDAALFLRVPPQSLGELLAPRRPEASWVVNEETGKPSGYSESECHPDLRTHDIISDVEDLRLKMRLDRTTARPRSSRPPLAALPGRRAQRLSA
jgi:hypothetical protein